jgi:hypothetical protein
MPSRMTCRLLQRLGATLLLLSPLSCSSSATPKLYPVRGIVRFDGKPAEGALVTLQPTDASVGTSIAPRGQVRADGSFEIATHKHGDGAPPGEYKVTIMWYPPDARQRHMEGKPLGSKFPALYGDAKTSPLTGTVREGPNEWPPFEVRASGPGKP